MYMSSNSIYNNFSGSSPHSIAMRELISFYLIDEANNHEALFKCLVTKVRKMTHLRVPKN